MKFYKAPNKRIIMRGSGGKFRRTTLNEIDELRRLAKWIEKNFAERSRPPTEGLNILNRVRLAQGRVK